MASQEKKIRLRKKVKSHAMCERTRTFKEEEEEEEEDNKEAQILTNEEGRDDERRFFLLLRAADGEKTSFSS